MVDVLQDDALGGEEFGALLFGAGESTAVSTAERIRRALMVATAEIDGKHVDATVSVGVAVLPADSVEDVAELLSRADNALYLAKERGRNRVEVAGRTPPLAGPPVEEARAAVATISSLRVSPPSVPQLPAANEDDIAWAEPQPLRVSGK